jgi:thiol-disulfide isomerase/thioredoxin
LSLQAGDPAPNLNTPFPDAEGTEYVLADALKSGPLLLGIYKSSCGASKAMMPILNRFVDRYGIFGLQVFGIAQDSANVTRSFIRRSGGLDYPVLIEGDDYPLSVAFDLFATPTVYVIRQDGTIAYTTMGFLRVQMEEFSRAVAGVLGVAYQPIIDEEVDGEIPLFVPG